jgi:hypothetical protein
MNNRLFVITTLYDRMGGTGVAVGTQILDYSLRAHAEQAALKLQQCPLSNVCVYVVKLYPDPLS